jgi:SSS family solute:Na+ symporter
VSAPANALVSLRAWDWIFLVWFLLVTTGVGLYYSKRAGKDLAEYFVSGRNLTWWALGTSMVATTFASDTPLVVSGFVIEHGIARNWLWWSLLFGGTLTVFVFSRMWRRSSVMTEIELIDIRYDGRPARLLRGFKAAYLGLFLNAIIFGWVTLAMSRVIEVVFNVRSELSIGILLVTAIGYTFLAGLWGVVAADILQFSMAIVGAVILAVLSVAEVGGLGQLVDRVQQIEVAQGREILALFPHDWTVLTGLVLIPLLFNWWAVYYPGSEPGGGGWVAQRMLAAKDERHARAGTLWFTIAHFVLRPWPWILVALAAMVLEPRFLSPETYGDAFAAEKAYPTMFQFLPVGMLGLVVASFFAAFISTITSVLNLSASYLVNDLYLPFLAPAERNNEREVGVARATVVLVGVIGVGVTWLLGSAGQGWTLVMDLTAGTGLVLLLRWLWWRVNAWSEISAMIASAGFSLLLGTERGGRILQATFGTSIGADMQIPVVVLLTTMVWLLVTYTTRPVAAKHLAGFYAKVRPGGWWGPVATVGQAQPSSLRRDLWLWATSSALVFGALFGVGSALLLDAALAFVFLGVAVIGGILTYFGLKWETT